MAIKLYRVKRKLDLKGIHIKVGKVSILGKNVMGFVISSGPAFDPADSIKSTAFEDIIKSKEEIVCEGKFPNLVCYVKKK